MNWEKLLFGFDPKKRPATTPKERLIVLSVDLLRILILILIVFTLYQFYQGREAKVHLEKATHYAQAGEWKKALSEANQSLARDSTLEASRMVVKAAHRVQSSELVRRARQLFRFKGATLQDRALALAVLLDARQLESVRALASELSEQEREAPEVRFQLARAALDSGDVNEAVRIANQQVDQKVPEIALLLAMWYPRTGLQEFYPDFEERLLEVINDENQVLALRGFDYLTSLRPPWRQQKVMEAAISRFEDLKSLQPTQVMQLEWLKTEVGQQEVESTVAQMVDQFQESHLSELVTWLANCSRNEEILDLTSKPEAQRIEGLFIQRLNALEQTKKWDELRQATENPPVALAAALKSAIQALVEASLGHRAQADTSWRDAMREAEGDQKTNWFFQISRLAQRAGNRGMEMEALVKSITHPVSLAPSTDALTPLFEWLVEKDDEKTLLEVSEILLRREPNHPVLINNYVYLKALYDKAYAQDAELLQRLVKVMPPSGVLLRSLAFVQLRLKDYEKALEALESLPEGEKATNSTFAIRARVLFEMGEVGKAQEVSKKVDWSQLTNQERLALELPGS